MAVAANRSKGAVADSILTDNSVSGKGERNRECREQEPRYMKEIELHLGPTSYFRNLQSVDCFTSNANYVQVHSEGQVHRVRGTMKELERRLDPNQFVRINRCTIVNRASIRYLRRFSVRRWTAELTNGTEFTVSPIYRWQIGLGTDPLTLVQSGDRAPNWNGRPWVPE